MKTLFFCPSCGTSNDFSQVKNPNNLIICYECKHKIGSLNELNGVPTKIVPPNSTSPRYKSPRIISWVCIATGVLIALLYILPMLNGKEVISNTENGNTSSESEQLNEINSSTTSIQNICSICGRPFSGGGYSESPSVEGFWFQNDDKHPSSICSISCGRQHTRKMKGLVREAERLGGQRNDGRLYETDACSMCKGTGIEKNTAQDVFGGADGRKCPMCDGRGVRSY